MTIIRLTHDCNEKCLFCNFQEKVADLSIENIKNQLEELRRNYEIVIFSGGEPTVIPFLADAVNYAVEQAVKIVAQLITVDIITQEIDETNEGDALMSIAKELRATNNIAIKEKGIFKENEAEMYKDNSDGLTTDEKVFLDQG